MPSECAGGVASRTQCRSPRGSEAARAAHPGSHPEGTEVSALDHILGTHATIPPDRGLFLEETWRLHPEICAFTSEVFYESRLQSRPGLDRQTITSKSRINGSGLRYLPVAHEGNQNTSPEEADQIQLLVRKYCPRGQSGLTGNT